MVNSTANQSDKIHKDAVVIGASIAGLLATRILLNLFDRVTVVEQDI